MDALTQLNDLNKHVTAQHEHHLLAVRLLIDRYWEYFHDENMRIAQLHATGQSSAAEINVNFVAPVVETKGNKGYQLKKVYIVWKKHAPRFRKNLKPSYQLSGKPSLALHTYSTIDATNILKRECTWNAQKAIELEQQLIQYRILLNTFHENIKKTSATIRSLEKTKAKKEEKND